MLAIIGGTGFYSIDSLDIIEEIKMETPFGDPSDKILKASYKNKDVYFLPRHGKSHNLLPHEINYRSNIWALKKVGVTKIISISAVGSLNFDIKPSDFVTVNQYFDHIKGNREKTFFGDGLVAHISTSSPSCENLSNLLYDASKNIDVDFHKDKSYICVDGPRLGTKIESNFFKNQVKADIIGMTNVPEAFLAKEAQISYCTLGIVTDYDCWMDDPEHMVTVPQMIERYKNSLSKVKQLLQNLFDNPSSFDDTTSRKSLDGAVLTPYESLNKDKKQLLDLLQK